MLIVNGTKSRKFFSGYFSGKNWVKVRWSNPVWNQREIPSRHLRIMGRKWVFSYDLATKWHLFMHLGLISYRA